MMVVLVTRTTCGLCGYLRKGFMFPQMRINKRSMRSYAEAGETPAGEVSA